MSAALLRKSLELVDSPRPSGFTQPNVSKVGNQGRSGGKRKQVSHRGEKPESSAIGNSTTRKIQRSSKQKAVLKELTEGEQEQVEENVRRLLMLSSCPAPEKIAHSIIKRTQRATKKVTKQTKKEVEEKTVFTETDFNNFNKSYFGR